MARSAGAFGASGNSQQAVLGFAEHGDGRVAVYGDSNCLDSSHQRSSCHNLLLNAISYVAEVRPNLSVAHKFFSVLIGIPLLNASSSACNKQAGSNMIDSIKSTLHVMQELAVRFNHTWH